LLKSIGYIPKGTINDYDAGRWDVAQKVEESPAADVVEVRHARWKCDYACNEYFCTNCNITQNVLKLCGRPAFKYCPMCGAKMDDER
jgi:hypothetical protein